MVQLDKLQIQRQFSRAANNYMQASGVQQRMSDELLELLRPHFRSEHPAVTDLGCGTGYSLQQILRHYPDARCTGIDLSPSMIEAAHHLCSAAEYQQADMEHYSAAEPQDMIFSNASIQWCDLLKVCRAANRSLNTGGLFALSSLGPDTYREIAAAWVAADGNEHRIALAGTDIYSNTLERSGFQLLAQRRRLVQVPFASTRELLDSIKNTGATDASQNRQRGLLSRQRYSNFLYQLAAQQPLQLSYETLHFVACKASDV